MILRSPAAAETEPPKSDGQGRRSGPRLTGRDRAQCLWRPWRGPDQLGVGRGFSRGLGAAAPPKGKVTFLVASRWGKSCKVELPQEVRLPQAQRPKMAQFPGFTPRGQGGS